MTRLTMAATALLVALGASGAATATASESSYPPPEITWSVTPADAGAPDGRAAIEIDLDPGATVTEHLAVSNLGATEATFGLSAADGYYTPTGRFTMLDAGRESVAAGTWIDVPLEVTVPAGETAIVPFTIAAPDNATPGDHAAGVAAIVTSAGNDESGSRVGVESRVGFRVLARVTGDLAPALEITAVTSSYATSWNPFQPGTLSLTYTVANTGNTALTIEDRLLGTLADRGDMLPGESRDIEVGPASAWPLFYVAPELTVTGLVAELPEGEVTASASAGVWAIPWPQLAVLIGVGLLVASALAGRRRSETRLRTMLDDARAAGRDEAIREVSSR